MSQIVCLNCNISDERVPLLVMQFRAETIYICPQCLPALIHKPEKLVDKLPGMQAGKPPEHEH
jgi:hypothetical protein